MIYIGTQKELIIESKIVISSSLCILFSVIVGIMIFIIRKRLHKQLNLRSNYDMGHTNNLLNFIRWKDSLILSDLSIGAVMLVSLGAQVASVSLIGSRLNALAEMRHRPRDFYFYLVVYMSGIGKGYLTNPIDPIQIFSYFMERITNSSNVSDCCYNCYNNQMSKL